MPRRKLEAAQDVLAAVAEALQPHDDGEYPPAARRAGRRVDPGTGARRQVRGRASRRARGRAGK
jgi:hypothetical protein